MQGATTIRNKTANHVLGALLLTLVPRGGEPIMLVFSTRLLLRDPFGKAGGFG